MGYAIGNYSKDSRTHRGWFIGTFMDEGAVKTDAVEIKYWEEDVGPSSHKAKISATFECTLVIQGSCKGVIDGREITLSAGEYIAIQPGTPSNIPTYITEPVIGLCIKAPSDPSAKKLIDAA